MNLSHNVVNKIAYNMFINKDSDNKDEINSLIKKVNLVIENELNPKQKQCITLHYYKRYSQKEIAAMLKITPACVCYHIKKAKNILYIMLKYHFL